MITARVSLIPGGMTISIWLRTVNTASRVLHTITNTFAAALSGTTLSNTPGLGAGASQ